MMMTRATREAVEAVEAVDVVAPEVGAGAVAARALRRSDFSLDDFRPGADARAALARAPPRVARAHFGATRAAAVVWRIAETEAMTSRARACVSLCPERAPTIRGHVGGSIQPSRPAAS